MSKDLRQCRSITYAKSKGHIKGSNKPWEPLSIVYNIGRNLIDGYIILSYVNTTKTPDCDMSYRLDGPIATCPKKYHICHIAHLKTLSHINPLIVI